MDSDALELKDGEALELLIVIYVTDGTDGENDGINSVDGSNTAAIYFLCFFSFLWLVYDVDSDSDVINILFLPLLLS